MNFGIIEVRFILDCVNYIVVGLDKFNIKLPAIRAPSDLITDRCIYMYRVGDTAGKIVFSDRIILKSLTSKFV